MPLELVQTLTGHSDRIWTLAWNPKGTILASSGGDKSIRLWAKNANGNWNCVTILTESHSKSIRRLCWSPCGQYLASASFDATVCLWRRNNTDSSWTTVINLEGHENEVKSVAWSSDGHYLASCGRDRTVWIWERAEVDDSVELEDDDNAENWDCSDVKNDHTKDVKHIIWHPQHNILVSCSYDDTVKFFHKEGDDWKCYETLTSHTSTVWSAAFSASGEFLATCSEDRTVRIWKNQAHNKLPDVVTNSWKCVSVIQGYHSRTIYDVSWCRSSDTLVSASGDNALAFYARSKENSSGQEDIFSCVDKFGQSHSCDINSVAWNQNQPGLLASAGDDCIIKLWKYSFEDKGMKPLSIVDELMDRLAKFSHDDYSATQLVGNSPSIKILNVSNFSNLQNLIQLFQNLQNEISQDEDRRVLEGLFDLKFTDRNSVPVKLSNLSLNEPDGTVKDFTISVVDNRGSISQDFKVVVDSTKFGLQLPRRSVKFLTIANEVFLIEKTGDLYRVTDSGRSHFLLGHLFMFSDIGIVTKNIDSDIMYVISADRDEKIRISNYPNTFEIERFCFGHKDFVRKILIVDGKNFVSIDIQNNACLWDLADLSLDGCLKPRRMVTLDGGASKRVCRSVVYPRSRGGHSESIVGTVTI